jgi:hypothetical protein
LAAILGAATRPREQNATGGFGGARIAAAASRTEGGSGEIPLPANTEQPSALAAT